MWGEDSNSDQRRPSIAPGRGGGLAAVPRWFWLVLAGILIVGATVALKIPFFLIFFVFFFGRHHVGGWFRHEFGPSTVQRTEAGGDEEPPTIRWGEARTAGQRGAAGDEVADPELREALTRGREQAARMRRTLAGINDRNVRLRVTNLVDDADRILGSLRDRGDTVLTRTFNDRYLAPATTILTRYTRLVSRDLTSARPVLDRVETHDLPLLQRKYDEFYEQVHRGDLIDLEVASEMLAFELEAPVNGTPSLSETDSATDQTRPVRWSGSDAMTGR